MSTAVSLGLIACCLLGASSVARSAEPPSPADDRGAAERTAREDPQPAPRAPLRSFELDSATLRRIVDEQREIPQSPEALRIAEQWRAGRDSTAIKPPEKAGWRARPALIECRRPEEKCVAYDADGRYLYTVPDSPRGVLLDDVEVTETCQSSNNMMSTFERADRCNGLMRATPSFWDPPARRYLPVDTRRD